MRGFLDFTYDMLSELRRLIGLSYNFRVSRSRSHLLSPKLLESVTLHAEPIPKSPTGDLFQAWENLPNGYKWLHYFDVYEKVLAPVRFNARRVLEIGVYHGASIAMWRSYFPPDCTVVGIDIDPKCKQYERQKDNLHIRIGSQADPDFLNSVIEEFGIFDVIIDDGSHMTSHVISSFNHLFGPGLSENGIYMVEDLQCAYWYEYRDQPYSFIEYAKVLVDLVHAPYFQIQGDRNFREGIPERTKHITVPRICTLIDELRFFDSIVGITKRTKSALPVTRHR